MKKIKIGILVLLVFSLTACGNSNYIVDDENTPVEYEKTGQILQKDILCRPEDPDLDALYEEYGDQTKIAYEDLPLCSEFSLSSNEADGIWEGIFVKPLAFLIMKLGYLINSFGLAVILIGLAIRLILMPITKKTAMQSELMKKAQPELQKLEVKYRGKESQEDQTRKAQEMLAIYQKYKINPISGCLLSFIQLPLLFAFLEAINRTPSIFENNFLVFQMGTTPIIGISQGNYWYILLLALILLTSYFSFRKTLQDQSTQAKQMKFTIYFMLGIIFIASFTLPTALGLYWITSSLFTIAQNIWVERRKDK